MRQVWSVRYGVAQVVRQVLQCVPYTMYGVCPRRTRLFKDQLWRADAGSWQIADRYATAS